MACLDDRSEYSLGLLESGVRDYHTWADRMKADLPKAGLTDGDLQRIYNESRIQELEAAKEARAKPGGENITLPPEMTALDSFVDSVGRKATARFITSLAESDGTNPLWDKIASGKDLTDDEEKFAAQKLRDSQSAPVKGPADTSMAARLRTALRGMVDPLREANRALTTLLKDPARVAEARNSIGDDMLKKIAQGTMTPDEKAGIDAALTRAARFEPPSPKEINAAKEQLRETRADARERVKQTFAESRDAKDVLKDWGYKHIPADQLDDFYREVDNAPYKSKALAYIVRRYFPEGVLDRVQAWRRAIMLNSPRTLFKVGTSHPLGILESELSTAISSVGDSAWSSLTGKPRDVTRVPASELYKAAQLSWEAKKDAWKYLTEGPVGLAMDRLLHPTDSVAARMEHGDDLDGLMNETWFGSKNPAHQSLAMARASDNPGRASLAWGYNKVLRGFFTSGARSHGGYYAMLKAFPAHTAFWGQAHAVAMREAAEARKAGTPYTPDQIVARRQYWYDNPSPMMTQNALHIANTATFTNDNFLTSAIAAIRSVDPKTLPPKMQTGFAAGQHLAKYAFPFARIAVNVPLRALEGVPVISSLGEIGKHVIEMRLSSDYRRATREAMIKSGLTEDQVKEGFNKALSEGVTPELKAQLSGMRGDMLRGISRNTIGSLVAVAGAQMLKAGYITPFPGIDKNDKNIYHAGCLVITINGKKHWFPIAEIGPTGTHLVIGATYQYLHDHGSSPVPALARTAISAVASNPFSSNAKILNEAGQSDKSLTNKGYQALETFNPLGAAGREAAGDLDPSDPNSPIWERMLLPEPRRVEPQNPLQALEVGTPGLRGRVPSWKKATRSSDSSDGPTPGHTHMKINLSTGEPEWH